MSKFFDTLLAAAVVAAFAATSAAQTPRPAGGAQTAPAAAKPAPAKPQAAPPTAAFDECGCEDGRLPEVLAVVGGVKLTAADFSPQTQQRIRELQQQVVEARKNEVNLQINSILLDAEAKKRGVSTTKLLEDEVVSKTVNPTDAEAQSYFEQNKARVEAQTGRPVPFSEVRDNVVAFLREERQRERAARLAETLRAASDVKVLVPEATPPANEADRARLLATVNGRRITSGDVEQALLPLVAGVREQVYAARRRDLDMKINDLLLSQEAQKRQVTPRALLDAEVASKSVAVTEADAQKFYNENKERVNGDFAQIKYQIIQYLEEQGKQKLEADLAERLRRAANVQMFLVAPTPPSFDIAVDDQPSKGSQSAAVTVVEFTDYQCPSCAAAHPVLERLVAETGDRVRLVVRDFPLAQHKDAFKAAEAAEAAREQGKYWEYTAVLYRNQSALGVEQLKQYATAVGLDRAKFDAALDSGKFSDKIWRDMLDGQKVGVGGTPTLFVNGRRVKDASYETVKAAIESALSQPARR